MPEINFKIVEVVVFRKSSPPEFLVLQRSDRDQIYPGLWQIVSGGIEQGEKAYEAALREIEEEIGMPPTRIFNTPLTNTFYFHTNDSVNVSPVFAAEVGPAAVVRLSPEHKQFRWLKKEEAMLLLVWPGQKKAVETVCDFIIHENPARGFMEIPF
ncbi:MAG: NUDIX pyrophosphatase [Bacteroidetes bacterium]|nr:NUDIX pyrophosphatase [Bacteroidota bacterium]